MNIKYAIVKNEMPASSAEAAYLGRVIPNGVKNRTQMTESALKTEHFAEATFNAVIDAAIALTEELCAEGRDVDWGPVKFLSKMHGSLPCEDSAFTDGTASLTLDADATNEAREAIDSLTPVKVGADVLASSVKVSNEMDVATEQFGVVIGTTEFYILGNGLTLDAEGEYVKAYNRKTEALAGTAQVISVSKGQRAKCKFDPQLGAGEFVLEIATKGLAEETTPRIFKKNVTSVRTANPVTVDPTGVIGNGVGTGGNLVWGNTFKVTGTGLLDQAHATGDKSYVSAVKAVVTAGGTETEYAFSAFTCTADGTSLVVDSSTLPEAARATTGTVKVKLVAKTPDGGTTPREDIVSAPAKDVSPYICRTSDGSVAVKQVAATEPITFEETVMLLGEGLDPQASGLGVMSAKLVIGGTEYALTSFSSSGSMLEIQGIGSGSHPPAGENDAKIRLVCKVTETETENLDLEVRVNIAG